MDKIFFILIICVSSYGQIFEIRDDLYKRYNNIPFKVIAICDIPQEIFDTCRLPFLKNGHIIRVKEEGKIWCSGTRDSAVIKDSCYIVVRTRYGYDIEWWKKSPNKWHILRIQHIKSTESVNGDSVTAPTTKVVGFLGLSRSQDRKKTIQTGQPIKHH